MTHQIVPGAECIRTNRLDLLLISVAELLGFDETSPDYDPVAARGIANPYGWFVRELGPLRRRVEQVRADPQVNPWLLRVIVERATNEAVGLINFHAGPDERGMLEVGYRIAEPRRREGLAREATVGLFHWAATASGVTVFRASIAPANIASTNLVLGLGMIEVGMQEDEEDGPEIIFEVPAAKFRGGAAGWY